MPPVLVLRRFAGDQDALQTILDTALDEFRKGLRRFVVMSTGSLGLADFVCKSRFFSRFIRVDEEFEGGDQLGQIVEITSCDGVKVASQSRSLMRMLGGNASSVRQISSRFDVAG
jgi:hypothetical protein